MGDRGLKQRNVGIRREFDAPLAVVFETWTTARLIEQWWGPPGFQTRVGELNLRVGGTFRFEMTSPTGSKGATAGVFRVIDEPHRLEFLMTEHCNCDLEPGQRPQLGPCVVTVTFAAINENRTELNLIHERLQDSITGERVTAGWSGSLSRLSEFWA